MWLMVFGMFVSIRAPISGQTLIISKSTSNASPAVAEIFNFVIDASCNSTTGDCENVVIRDTLPGTVEFLNFSFPLPDGVSSATYDISSREIVILFDATTCIACTPDGSGDEDDFAQGASIQLLIQVRFPNGTISGAQAHNTAYGSSDNAGNPSSSATASVTGGMAPGVFPNDKRGDPSQIAGGYQYYQIEVGNLGFSDIDNYMMIDTIPDSVTLDQVRTPQFLNVNHTGQLYYMRSDIPGTWNLWTSFNLNTRTTRYVSGLGLPGGVEVTQIRMDLGTVPGNGLYNPYIYPSGFMRSLVLYAYSDLGFTIGDSYINCVNYSGTIGGGPVSGQDCATTSIVAPTDEITGDIIFMDESENTITNAPLGDTILLGTEFASPGLMGFDVVGGVLTTILPPNLSYVPGSWYFEWGHESADFHTPVIQTGTTIDGRDFVRMVFDSSLSNSFTIEPLGSWSGFRLDFLVYINPSAIEGDQTFEYYFNATHSTPGNCGEADTDNYLGGYAGTRCYVFDDLTITRPPSSAGLQAHKESIGTLDASYEQYPSTGNTVPGGISNYKVVLRNPNATPIDNIILVDILPFIGDTEILDNSTSRFSQWRPNLAASISAPTGVTVYYSLESNPCRDELAGGNPTPYPTGCSSPAWSSTPPSDITTVRSLRFDASGITLNQNDSLVITWDMRTPVSAPTGGEIAWNSFAYIGNNASTMTPLLPAEPIKVGIATQPGTIPIVGNYVWEDANANGVQDVSESGIDGVVVTLYEDTNANGVANPGSGDNVYGWTVTANDGLYLFSDFPTGDYFIVFSNFPSGYVETHQDVGVNDNEDSDGATTGVITFTGTSDFRNYDLGLYNGVLPPLIEICNNGLDDDSDGLIDCFDCNDCGPSASCIDTDGDGLSNSCDLDDDNDGILDHFEVVGVDSIGSQFNCDLPFFDFTGPTLESGINGQVGAVYRYSNVYTGLDALVSLDALQNATLDTIDDESGAGLLDNFQPIIGSISTGDASATFSFQFVNTGTSTLANTITRIGGTAYDVDGNSSEKKESVHFHGAVNSGLDQPTLLTFEDTGIGHKYTALGTYEGPNLDPDPRLRAFFSYLDTARITMTFGHDDNILIGPRRYSIRFDECEIADFVAIDMRISAGLDRDQDGIEDYLDLDSDNDGIYDAIESGSGDTQANGRLTGGIDLYGIPLSVSDGSGGVDYAYANTDSSDDLDAYDPDADGDNCFDTTEENISDVDGDGIAGSGIPSVDADGLVTSITYSHPPYDTWQNANFVALSCDTDNDNVNPLVDIDDDNDGIPDIIESGIDSACPSIGSVSFPAYDYTNCSTISGGQLFTNIGTYGGVDIDMIVYDIGGASIDCGSTGDLGCIAGDDGFTVHNTDPDSIMTISFFENGTSNPVYINWAVFLDDFDAVEGISVDKSNLAAYILNSGNGTVVTDLGAQLDFNSQHNSQDEITFFFSNVQTVSFRFSHDVNDREICFSSASGSIPNNPQCAQYQIVGLDSDGDGVFNHLDLDSDNDGIFDVDEAGHSSADANDDGVIDGGASLFGSNGLFDALETVVDNGILNYAVADSEASPDSTYDAYELDADGDGCFDTEEESVADGDSDGIAGTGIPTVDANGLVTSISYSDPPNDTWQNPLIGPCLSEICNDGIDNDADGDTDCADTDCEPSVSLTLVTDEDCVSSTTLILSGASPAGGTYSGAGVTGTNFDASTAGAGSHTITYSYTDGNGCSNNATDVITVHALPTVSLTLATDEDCVTSTSLTLSGGSPVGGSYSGAGVTGTNFDASTAGIGSHTITYTFTDSNGCTNSATDIITVHSLPSVSLTLSTDQECITSSSFTLSGGSPAGGTFSGPGVSGTNFDATIAGLGLHTITYTYTDGNGCTNSNSDIITVYDDPSITSVVSNNPTTCGGSDGNITINATGGSGSLEYRVNGGTWQSSNSFSGLSSGSYNIDVRNNNGTCVISYVSNPVVLSDPSPPVANILLPPPECESSPVSITATDAGAGASYSWTFGAGASPGAATGLGPHLVTYSGGGMKSIGLSVTLAGCIAGDTDNLLIHSLPTVALTLSDTEECLNNNSLTLNGGSPSGGTYSGPGVSGGIFDASAAGIGTHTITYTYTDGNGCSDSATDQIEVITIPDITNITHTDETCDSDNGTITFSFTDDPANSSIEFSIDGGGSWPGAYNVNDNAGSFTISSLAPGTYDLWVRWGNNKCEIDLSDVTIDPEPIPSISAVVSNNPYNCPVLDNGQITIVASGSNLEYSINAGSTWQSSSIFMGLTAGNYVIHVRDTGTGCVVIYGSNPITQSSQTCTELCFNNIDDDGDGLIDENDSDCDNSCNETVILMAQDGGAISQKNINTGAQSVVTYSPYTSSNLNALAANPDASLIYYGRGQTVYYWDPSTDIHGVVLDMSSFVSANMSLTSGGGAYYNNYIYMGFEDDTFADFPEVWRIPVSSNGLTPIGDAERLNIPLHTNTSWGDLITSRENGDIYLYMTLGNNFDAFSTYSKYNINTGTYSVISTTMISEMQVGVDINGELWGGSVSGGYIRRFDKNTGNFYGSSVSISGWAWDLSGPINCAQKPEICTNGIDDDADGLIDCVDPDCNASGNADVVFSSVGIPNQDEALGPPDGVGAELFENGDEMVLDLTNIITTGGRYTITWRRALITLDPSISVEESTDGVTYTPASGSPFTLTLAHLAYSEQDINASVDTRYLRVSNLNGYNMYFDAVGYSLNCASYCPTATINPHVMYYRPRQD